MTQLSQKMLDSLFQKAKEDGKSFPLELELKVGEEIVTGFMYDDGHFEQGATAPRESEMDAESEASAGSSEAGV